MSAAVRSIQRHTRKNPCSICGGCEGDPRGNGLRCTGFASTNGEYVHCSREERAGSLAMIESSQTYAHRAKGPCRCGAEHAPADTAARGEKLTIAAVYTYQYENGEHAYDVVRFEPKTFRPRRRDGKYTLEGVRRVLYRLPQVLASPKDAIVFLVEGERDVESLEKLGLVATTSPSGARNWRLVAEHAREVFAGRHVVVIPDDDDDGRRYRNDVVSTLIPVAASVRVIALPGSKDASDWIAAGGTVDQLRAIVDACDATSLTDVDVREVPSGYGRSFIEFVGDEPDDNPADVFDAHGLIVRGEPSLIVGHAKVGKTMLVEDLAMHLAAGRKEWCGVPLYRRCRTKALLHEDSERTTRRRYHQLARGAGIDHVELDGWLSIDAATPFYFDDPAHVAKLERQLSDVDVLILDSLSTTHNGDENSVERMAPIMNKWRDLSLTTNTAIVVIHHFRKQSEGAVASGSGVLARARGSSIIGATTRHAVGIEKGPADHQVVISVESNHEVDVEPFVIQRRFGFDDKGRRFITHGRLGTLRDALNSSETTTLDPIVLAAIAAAGVDGIGSKDLRTAANDELRMRTGNGVRPVKIDATARRLEKAGDVEKFGTKWRVRTGGGE